MFNKTVIFFGMFFSFGVPVFTQWVKADTFISNFFWYQKYLPQENILELHTLQKFILLSKEQNRQEFSRALENHIRVLDNKVFDQLQQEMVKKDDKIKELLKLDEAGLKEIFLSKADIQTVANQYEAFKKETEVFKTGEYPKGDDQCFDIIEEYYSRLITRQAYKLSIPAVSPPSDPVPFSAEKKMDEAIANLADKPQSQLDDSLGIQTLIPEPGETGEVLANKPPLKRDDNLGIWTFIPEPGETGEVLANKPPLRRDDNLGIWTMIEPDAVHGHPSRPSADEYRPKQSEIQVPAAGIFAANTMVSNRDYISFITHNGINTSLRGEHKLEDPALLVAWNDAVRYCNWLSRLYKLAPCYIEGDKGEIIGYDKKRNGYRLPDRSEIIAILDSQLGIIDEKDFMQTAIWSSDGAVSQPKFYKLSNRTGDSRLTVNFVNNGALTYKNIGFRVVRNAE